MAKYPEDSTISEMQVEPFLPTVFFDRKVEKGGAGKRLCLHEIGKYAESSESR